MMKGGELMVRYLLVLLCLLLAMTLTGCADKTAAPDRQSSPASNNHQPIAGDDTRAPETANKVSAPVTSVREPQVPAAAANPEKVSNPVIVQSQPETDNDDADAVLNDISKELDDLTLLLKELEQSDAAWDQEVGNQ